MLFELESGDPIAGASVRATAGGRFARSGREHAVSDQHGRFLVRVRTPGRHTLSIHSDRHVDRVVPDVEASAATAPPLRISLSRGLSVSGRALDLETGEPIRVGRVGEMGAYRLPSATLDSEGRFTISGLTTPVRSFRVWSEGWSSSSFESDPPPRFDATGRQTQGAIVRVPRAPALRGVVHGVNGEPISDASIVFSIHSSSRAIERIDAGDSRASTGVAATTSDATGRFVLPAPIPRGGSMVGQLLVRHPRYAPRWIQTSSDADVSVSMDRGTELKVRVENADGSPAAHARAKLLRADAVRARSVMLGDSGQITCDDRGVGRFAYVSDGNWVVRAESAAGASACESAVLVEQGRAVELGIRLEAVDRVFGRVLDGAGRPVSDVLIQWGSPPRGMLVAGDDGRFSAMIPDMSLDSLIVHDSVQGGDSIPLRRNEEMMIVVGADAFTRRLHLSIVDEATQEPIPSGQVRVGHARDNGCRHRDTPFSCGEAWLLVPADAAGSLRCGAYGYQTRTAELQHLELREGAAVLSMQPAQHPAAAAVSRVSLSFSGGGRPEWIGLYDADSGRRWPSPRHVRDSRYEFYWPTAVPGILLASGASGYAGPHRFSARPDEAEADVEMHWRADGGRVGGRAQAGTGVYLRDADGRQRTLPVRADGSFLSGQIRPGTYSVRSGGGPWMSVTVSAGADVEVELP